LVYRDVGAAIKWLTEVFGFKEHYRYGDPSQPQGAQMQVGNAYVMLGVAQPGKTSPSEAGFRTQYLTIFVDDVAAHYERTKAAGAKIIEELNETMYGERQYVAQDPEGHPWLFSQHVKDVAPADWGAIMAKQ
jgi:uncharacterized glyoxalase superfamily protein PhnB